MRLDPVQFAGLTERREHGPILRNGIVTDAERVLSLQPNRANGAFHSIAVHIDTAIGQEQ